MNTTQRKILKWALAGIVVTLLFPPFLFGWPAGGYAGMGYGFILSWPTESGHKGFVHVGLLLIECMRPTLPRGFSQRDPVEGADEAATTYRCRC